MPSNACGARAVEASVMGARRRIGLGLFASGLVHAAAAGAALWLAARERGEDEPEPEPDPAELERAEIEVDIVEDPAPTAVEAGSSSEANSGTATGRARLQERTGNRRPATGRQPATDVEVGGETDSGSERETGSPAPRGTPDLDPRRAVEGAVPDLGPPPPRLFGGLIPRKPPRVRSELRPDGPGGFQTDDGPFVARTDRDGKVRFEDRSSVRFDVPAPRQMVEDMARAGERWAEDPRRYAEDSGNQSRIALGGQIEMTDMAMRAAGQDPYAARKMELLDRTRDERMQIATRENRERLRESLQRTWADLGRLWRGPGSAAEKRRLLFQLWDECAESGSDEVVDTARAVRGQIIAFVRRHLPAGSRLGYSAAELARHNRSRSSKARFDPYAAAPPD